MAGMKVEGNGDASQMTPPPVKKEHADASHVMTPTSTTKPPAVLSPGHRFPSKLIEPLRAQIHVYKAFRKGSMAESIDQNMLAISTNVPRVVDSARPTNREELKERASQHPQCRHQGEPLYYLTAGLRDHRDVAPQYLPEVRFELMPPNDSLPGPAYDDVPSLIEDEYQRLVRYAVQRKQQQAEARSRGQLVAGFTARDGKLPRSRVQMDVKMVALLAKQQALRAEVERQQETLSGLSDKMYRKAQREAGKVKFDIIRQHERKRIERNMEIQRQLKVERGRVNERASQLRDWRLARNKWVARFHERQSRGHNKDDRSKRLDALKANDFQAYQDMLRQQGKDVSSERYEAIATFLNDTEEYLNKLANKVKSVKMFQQTSEARARAMADARAQGLTEDDVRTAGEQAANEAAAEVEEEMGAADEQAAAIGDAQSRYYNVAHSIEESITQQPQLLRPPRGATLREYQMVGLQWMVSLYNNRLNGILADEMGLGKTVQVMALIAYLMEAKGNYGPHLIIVPNAVIVNWKSELSQWLPSVRCVYYVGSKDERLKKYQQEVQSLQFNVLVTTYEFIMRDRTRLSKVEWKYLIIDEAQRMKDRQSKLAKDLDRFVAHRRLLLTGTPLQNELRELWSLLNLLLPEVFDDKKGFTEWFGDVLGGGGAGGADEWLEKEKRVVVIHRLHQILEPFMLRRQVEDVESKLPPKRTLVVKTAMTPYQSAIYEWVKTTGTLRMDPWHPLRAKTKRDFVPLQNKCMELRKVCNHPCLTYSELVCEGDDLVRQCGKMIALDNMLVKLFSSGHRVLLFSTMTKLLDTVERYLKWRRLPDGRQMEYLRIDGSTTLEDRESAIQRFNNPEGGVFIFLLSIRAAGRGLNLQTSDTVIIYDPDANPKNEEQAIARAHRIGQTKEVRVIHFEAVCDIDGNYTGMGPMYEPLPADAPPRHYADSIESLVRNNIQKMKIDMANEVIDAGRFDMQTSMDERKQTLEALLDDEEKNKHADNAVPTWTNLNKLLARTPQEMELFEQLDREHRWPTSEEGAAMPDWIRFTAEQQLEARATTVVRPSQVHRPAAADGPFIIKGGTVKRKRVPTGRKRGGQKAAKPTESSRPSGSQGTSQPGSELTAAPGGDEDEAEGGGAGLLDDADTEEEQIDANIAVDYLDMADTAAPSGMEGSQSAQWTEASGGGVSGQAGGDEEGSRKKSRIGLKVKFSAAPR